MSNKYQDKDTDPRGTLFEIKLTKDEEQVRRGYQLICKQQRELAGLEYDWTKDLYDNLFACDTSGCLFKNIWLKEYLIHINKQEHFFDKKTGVPAKVSVNVVPLDQKPDFETDQ